jgi:hypothetical protein
MNGSALKFVPEKYKTAEICLAAVQNYGYALEYVPLELITNKLCTEAVRRNPRALFFFFFSLRTRALCRLAVSDLDIDSLLTAKGDDPLKSAIAYIPLEFITLRLCYKAIKNDFESFRFIPEKFITPVLCRAK